MSSSYQCTLVVRITVCVLLSIFCLDDSRTDYLNTVTGFSVKGDYFVFYAVKCLVDNL